MGIVLLRLMVMLLYPLLMRLSALNTVVSREAACWGGAAPSRTRLGLLFLQLLPVPKDEAALCRVSATAPSSSHHERSHA